MTAPVRPTADDPVAAYLAARQQATTHPSTPSAPASDPVQDYLRARDAAQPPERSALDDIRDAARVTIGQGALAGFGDEAEAALRAPFSSRSYGEIRDEIRGQIHDYQQTYPRLAPVQEFLGALTPGLALGARESATPSTPLGRLGVAGSTGAAYGAASGAGHSEGDLGDRAVAGLEGAIVGGIGGTVLSGAGQTLAGLAKSYQVGPRLLTGLAALSPSSRLADALRQRAATMIGNTADAAYAARLAQDGETPATARAKVAATHESIPVAAADVGGENVRQMTGAVKRLPGPSKSRITQALEARAENAPTYMLGSLERNTPEASAALGIPGALDTRTANPDEIGATARGALGDRFAPRYAATLAQPTTYSMDALANLQRLLARPSMQQASRSAVRLAAEADETIPRLTLTEAPPVFDEAGTVAVPARTVPGATPSAPAAPVAPPATPTAAPTAAPAPAPTAAAPARGAVRPGTKLGDLVDAAHRGEDVVPPSGKDQDRFYAALNDDALARQWQRESLRMAEEDQRFGDGQWVRQQDDGSVVSGGSTQSGRGKIQGQFARARLGKIEAELRGRGFTQDQIDGLWMDEPLPARAPAPQPGPTRAAAAALDAPAPSAAPRHAGPGLDYTGSARVPAPTAAQLHYTKLALDRQITDLQDRITAAASTGDPARGARTDLRRLMDTRAQLLDAIDNGTTPLVPGYRALAADYAREVQPIDAFRRGMGISPFATPWSVESAVNETAGNANSRTALGAGYGRRLMDEVTRAANSNQNPARVVVGAGSEAATKTQNLRTLFGTNADAVEADAAALDAMHRTHQRVLGNSATAERQAEDAALPRMLRFGHAVMHSRPLEALDALMGGEYGPQSAALAERLMLGAQPGERQQLLDYLGGLGQRPGARLRAALAERLLPRATGGTAGYLAGQATR